MPRRSRVLRRAGLRPSAWPAPPRPHPPTGSSPLHRARVRSRPNSLLIAAIPHFGDPAIDYAKYFHAANGGLGAVLEPYRRLIDDRHVFPVVACDHEVQIEASSSDTSHMSTMRWTASSWVNVLASPLFVPHNRIAHQLFSEREIALIPDDQVVQLHHLTSGTGHSNTSSASISSMVATARSVSFTHNARERSGMASQPFSVITGRIMR